MDPRQFDSLVRRLGIAATRRGALGAILVGLVAPVLGEEAQADRKKGKGKPGRNNGKSAGRAKGRGRKQRGNRTAANSEQAGECRREGHPCEGNQRCCDDLVCMVSGPGEAERCTPCGVAGQPCCDEQGCDDESICDTTSGQCVACGGADQPCCAEQSCDGGFVCDGGECVPCGGSDQLCCEDGGCDDGFNCTDDGCEACGDEGLDCCVDGPACDGGQICTQGGQCTACGGLDQPCCAEEACDGGFVCQVNECVPCGDEGQACCAGADACGTDLSCDDDGLCSSTCGDEGEACCANGSCGENLVCDEGTCATSCDSGDVTCVIDGHGQCVPGICCEEGEGPGCEANETCIAGGCINENQFRAVLRWGAEPRDIDSHLWLPPASPDHVYWSEKGTLAGFPNAELDIDDVSGFGPETITIDPIHVGTYIYAVHHFAGLGTIGTSGATVQVFKGANLVAEYEAPTDAPWDGQPQPPEPADPYNDGVIWWQVFSLTYDGTTATITDIDVASNDAFVPYGNPGPFSALARADTGIPLKSQATGGNQARRRSRKANNRRRARR